MPRAASPFAIMATLFPAIYLFGHRPMSEVTRILSAIEQGDPAVSAELLPLVYEELRQLAAARLAQEKPGQTLQPTALVHEAYLRLVDGHAAQCWDNRGHFFAAAADATRRMLVNRARGKNRLKRGGGRALLDFDQVDVAAVADVGQVLA